MFDYSATMIQAEMAWIARFTARLEAGQKEAEGGQG